MTAQPIVATRQAPEPINSFVTADLYQGGPVRRGDWLGRTGLFGLMPVKQNSCRHGLFGQALSAPGEDATRVVGGLEKVDPNRVVSRTEIDAGRLFPHG